MCAVLHIAACIRRGGTIIDVLQVYECESFPKTHEQWSLYHAFGIASQVQVESLPYACWLAQQGKQIGVSPTGTAAVLRANCGATIEERAYAGLCGLCYWSTEAMNAVA